MPRAGAPPCSWNFNRGLCRMMHQPIGGDGASACKHGQVSPCYLPVSPVTLARSTPPRMQGVFRVLECRKLGEMILDDGLRIRVTALAGFPPPSSSRSGLPRCCVGSGLKSAKTGKRSSAAASCGHLAVQICSLIIKGKAPRHLTSLHRGT